MTNEITVFESTQFGMIRTIDESFVAQDVCRALDLEDVSKACSRLDEDEKLVRTMFASGQNRAVLTVNESGLYHLIMTSRLAKAKEFRKWVTSEVLPAIRKHGTYVTQDRMEEFLSDPDTMIRTLMALKSERSARLQAEERIKLEAPKVAFANSVTCASNSILIRDLAKVICQNGIDTGERRLFQWLRDNGYLIKREGRDFNNPTQRSIEMGLFQLKEVSISHGDGQTKTAFTTLVTGKGQIYFVNKFLQGVKA